MDASLRYASFSMTDDVIPNAVRNPVWMLRYAQHDKSESNHGECSFLSFRAKRGIQYGCFTALRFVQHDRRCHSERSEESSVDASLRSA